MRILLEPLQHDIEKGRATVREINAVLDQAGSNLPRLLHGIDETTWTIMEDAIELGYGIRVGFEDTLKFADGTIAQTNVDLVKEAIAYVGTRPR